MERIDQLENDISGLKNLLDKIKSNSRIIQGKGDIIIGESQSLRDKEIIEFIGDDIDKNQT